MLKWKFKAGDILTKPPLVHDKTVYFGPQQMISGGYGVFHALSLAGTPTWMYQAGYRGGFTSPAIGTGAFGDDGTVYFGVGVTLIALNPGGTVKWTLALSTTPSPTGIGGMFVGDPVLGIGGTIIIGFRDAMDTSGEEPDYVIVVNADGRLFWKARVDGSISASKMAVATDGTIYYGARSQGRQRGGSTLNALNPTGSVKWVYSLPIPSGGPGQAVGSPTLSADGTLYFGSSDFGSSGNIVYAVDAKSGTLKWSFNTTLAVTAAPAVGSDGTVCVGCADHYLYAITAAGKIKWKYLTGDTVASPGVGAKDTVYVGSSDGFVYAISATGTLVWKYQTGDRVTSAPVLHSDTLYIGSYDTYLYAFTLQSAP